ncbi:hypothetical protein BJ322DRAFT_641200 [Thelephora terrestris]|uniref:C2H2-type domain-containing protein n=1 Tax=Thelephora terrestris TaxID=56493 RepID=A0A9P6L9M6_9AGAM|nr:hypothetical protein BJ322DRAFT_641200 [Thelephora terrestris]
MGKKNKGPVPCDACDHSFASIPHLQQHVRDKHRNSLKQAPSAQAQPPVAQEPRVQTQNEPAHTVRPTSYSERALTGLTCEYCLTRFMTSYTLDQHKAMFHSWKCTKCPALPPFQHELAWQMHLNAVHATAGAKGKGAVTPANKGKMNDQRSGANHDTNTKVRNLWLTWAKISRTAQGPKRSNPTRTVSFQSSDRAESCN